MIVGAEDGDGVGLAALLVVVSLEWMMYQSECLCYFFVQFQQFGFH